MTHFHTLRDFFGKWRSRSGASACFLLLISFSSLEEGCPWDYRRSASFKSFRVHPADIYVAESASATLGSKFGWRNPARPWGPSGGGATDIALPTLVRGMLPFDPNGELIEGTPAEVIRGPAAAYFAVPVISDPFGGIVKARLPGGELDGSFFGGRGASSVALEWTGKWLYLGNFGDDSIGRYDPEDPGRQPDIIQLPSGSGPNGLALSWNCMRLYTPLWGRSRVAVVNLEDWALDGEFAVGGVPGGLDVSPDGQQLAVTIPELNRVEIYDTFTHNLIRGIDGIPSAWDVRYDPTGGRAYAVGFTATGEGSLHALDTSRFRSSWTVPVGQSPASVEVSPDGAFAFAANFGSGDVSVVDTWKRMVIHTEPVGARPLDTGMAWSF